MSRPRKPFGASHPGRLPATMMKVLAAEMSDPQRLRRGKQYAHDGSVTDIIIEPGIVTCEVQGSRSTPYIAQIEVTAGDGMPLRRDITAQCSCPDDDIWDDYACKHVVAAMFMFSDELLIEPELLDVWRGREPGSTTASTSAARTGTSPSVTVQSASTRPASAHTCDSCTPCRAAPAAATRPASSRSSPTSRDVPDRSDRRPAAGARRRRPAGGPGARPCGPHSAAAT